MSAITPDIPAYSRNLGNGLLLRWSTEADTDRLAKLYSDAFRSSAEQPPNRFVVAWLHDLMSGRHPLIRPTDFAVVEDTGRKSIVASTCLLDQVWQYDDIPFPVGRPEFVASDSDYRNRGLVRALFQLIHARSAAAGHIVQGITGIYYFYRQFGYEYALDLGGHRTVYFSAIPRLKEGDAESYRLRRATIDDIPLIMSLYDRERAGALVSVCLDERYWRYNIDGFGPETIDSWHTQIIVSVEEQPIGYVLTGRALWEGAVLVVGFSLVPGVSMRAVMPAVLRELQTQAPRIVVRPGDPPASGIRFGLGRAHPAYDALGDDLAVAYRPPYAWYMRVPDLSGFIRHVAPVLERRLRVSAAAGHTGELKLGFYRDGLRLAFKDGRLIAAETWRAPMLDNDAQGGFPPLVFLQLLFGYRSLAELRHAFPDVWTDDEGTALLQALFPPQRSWALPQD